MTKITKTTTAKRLAEDLGVDKMVAYNFLNGIAGLGLAETSAIDRPGQRGRREVAYTLADVVVEFLNSRSAAAVTAVVVPSMVMTTKDSVEVQVEVPVTPATEVTFTELPVLDLAAFEASQEPDLEYTAEELAQFPQAE